MDLSGQISARSSTKATKMTSRRPPPRPQQIRMEAKNFKPGQTMLAQKLQNSSFSTHEEKKGVFTRETSDRLGLGSCKRQRVPAHGYKLQDANLLSDCISSAAICSSCRNPKSKLQLYQCDSQKEGLAESLLLICSLCDKKTPLKTSKRLGGFGGGAHEVNRRSVVASHKLGLAGLTDFCSRMNLSPPVTKKAYNDHLIQIEKAAVENATVQMQNAADRLFKRVERESPESVEEEEGTRVAKVAVSVDGTWQKRGHSSKIGVVFVISIRTGKILDYEVVTCLPRVQGQGTLGQGYRRIQTVERCSRGKVPDQPHWELRGNGSHSSCQDLQSKCQNTAAEVHHICGRW